MRQTYCAPHWRPFYCWNTHHLPPSFRLRLLDRGSTTRRVSQDIKNQVGLKILSHGWQLPRYEEMFALANSRRQMALVREVVLFCNEQAWMFARTVIPRQTLAGKGWILRSLGERPLGQVLFTDPLLQRSTFELALLDEQQQDYHTAIRYCKEPPTRLWARRSIFLFYNKPLLLTEVFLPHPILLMQ